jgi:prepilin-type N-terminal cleavage/methylation domain-containing protein
VGSAGREETYAGPRGDVTSMNKRGSQAGITVVEMMVAVAIICILATVYFMIVDSYRHRRMSEQAAKVLMQAARAEEQYFAKEHRYFDADVSGNGGGAFLTTPGGGKTSVRVPQAVILSLKAQGKDNRHFIGYAFFTGSKILHRYDSQTGKMTTAARIQDGTG